MSSTSFRSCVNCGSIRDANDTFCGNCGKPFNSSVDNYSTPLFSGQQQSPLTPTQHNFIHKSQSNKIYLIVIAVLVLLLIGAGFLDLGQFLRNNSLGTGAVTNIPTITVTMPAPTSVPQTGTVLYQENRSDNWHGWAGSQDWKVVNGELVNDGTNFSQNPQPTIVAPYVVRTADYAEEVTIHVLQPAPTNYCFDVNVRGTSTPSGWYGYKGVVCPGFLDIRSANGNVSVGDLLARTTFNAGNTWHVYRLEVQGSRIRFFVDGNLLDQAEDYKYLLSGGQVGLKSFGVQIEVSSFKIIAI